MKKLLSILFAMSVLCLCSSAVAQEFSAEVISPEDGSSIKGKTIRIWVHTTAPYSVPEPITWGWNFALFIDGELTEHGYQFGDDYTWYHDYRTNQRGPHVLVAQIANQDYSIVVNSDPVTIYR